MLQHKPLVIAVDFDGTIVEHRYPAIGPEMPFAIDSLKVLMEKGHKLILWTIRDGKELDEAVEFLKKKGVEFYAVNNTYPEENYTNDYSRKVNADVFIDDRNVGGFLGWSKIMQHLHPEAYGEEQTDFIGTNNKPGAFEKMKGWFK